MRSVTHKLCEAYGGSFWLDKTASQGDGYADVNIRSEYDSSAFWIRHMTGFSATFNPTETVASFGGTVKLQASNSTESRAEKIPAGSWVDITGSDVAASGSTAVMWNVNDCYYHWVRVILTTTSGACTFTLDITAKGV